MTLLFNTVLILLIAGGLIGLLTGLFNIIRIKGDKQHVLVGKLFLYSMDRNRNPVHEFEKAQ